MYNEVGIEYVKLTCLKNKKINILKNKIKENNEN